jgi:hypothetical protein
MNIKLPLVTVSANRKVFRTIGSIIGRLVFIQACDWGECLQGDGLEDEIRPRLRGFVLSLVRRLTGLFIVLGRISQPSLDRGAQTFIATACPIEETPSPLGRDAAS